MDFRLRLVACSALATITIMGNGCGDATRKPDARSVHEAHTSKAPRSLPIDPDAKPQPGGVDQSGPVVARIGHIPITNAALQSRMEIEARTEEEPAVVPVPPAYTACVARLAVAASVAGDSPGRLLNRCKQRYHTLLTRVLGSLITSERVIAQAAKEGVGPTEHQIHQRLEQLKAVQFGSEAAFKAFLAKSGENVPDLLFTIEAQLANEAVFNKLRARTEHPTPGAVARYYSKHKHRFFVPEQRDLGIVRTKSSVVAHRIRRELEAGASFETVAKRLPNVQAVGVTHGLLTGLKPHVYAERNLNDAIFSAARHELVGPLKVSIFPVGTRFHKPRGDIQDVDGYYIFEVFKIRPAHTRSLAEVKADLTQNLPRVFFHEAVAAYTRRYRANWKSLTDCKVGYVVRKCRQFRPKSGEPAEDPYTLS
jgi:PPIC-type PPIASE domain